MAPRRPQDGSLISWALSGLKATKKQAKSKHLRWSTSVSVRFFAPLRRFPLLRNKFWGAAACPPQAFSIRPLPGFSLGAVLELFCLTRLSQSVLVCLKTSESLPGPQRIPPAFLISQSSAHFWYHFWNIFWTVGLDCIIGVHRHVHMAKHLGGCRLSHISPAPCIDFKGVEMMLSQLQQRIVNIQQRHRVNDHGSTQPSWPLLQPVQWLTICRCAWSGIAQSAPLIRQHTSLRPQSHVWLRLAGLQRFMESWSLAANQCILTC